MTENEISRVVVECKAVSAYHPVFGGVFASLRPGVFALNKIEHLPEQDGHLP